MKLKKIQITGMHKVYAAEYNLADLNYLQGPNGVGKSTVLQAIQLALLGYIPGMNKTNEGIFANANSNTLSVSASLVDDDGTPIKVTRKWKRTAKNIISSVEVTPEGYDLKSVLSGIELPIFNFSEFVGMTANKLKDWFIAFLPASSTEIDWEARLLAALGDMTIVDKELMPDTLSAIRNFNLTGVDLVRRVNEYLKSEQSSKKAELARLQSTIQSLVYYDDCDPAQDPADVEAELAQLRSQHSAEVRKRDIFDYNQRLRSEMAAKYSNLSDSIESDVRYIDASSKRTEAAAKLPEISAKLSELRASIADRNALVSRNTRILSGGGVCPYTTKPCEHIASQIQFLQVEQEGAAKEANEQLQDYNELSQQYRTLQNTVAQYDRTIADIQAAYRSRDQLMSKLADDAQIAQIRPDTSLLEATIAEKESLLIKLRANQKYAQLTNKLISDRFQLEQDVEILKQWVKLTDVNGLQTEMMELPFLELSQDLNPAISTFFGEGTTAKFHLTSKANSFSFGIERDHLYIPFTTLSSGEKCLYTLSLMICLIMRSDSSLKLILIDDLLDHLDDHHMEQLFASLYDVQGIQFVLAGVKPCRFAESIKCVQHLASIA